ncbi:universal stress protein [Streptomyces sp. NPDC058955]|uniref:universal stress protein n=1 Tax=unclassified Streptomyces TaxID=2593676 RepID=UPI003667ED4A
MTGTPGRRNPGRTVVADADGAPHGHDSPAGPAAPLLPGAVLAAVRDDGDLGCARTAAHEALRRRVPLRLLHVWRTARPTGAGSMPCARACAAAEEHARVLTRMAGRLRDEFPGLTVETEGTKHPSVIGALVEASRDAGLLVAGGDRPSGPSGPAPGRTALTLLRHAHCPVELVPRHGPGHGSTS